MRSDAELVAEALAGSQAAYREIVARYERPVFSLVARMVRDTAIAEDLSQDAFVKAFSRLHTFDRHHKFSSWLFTIASHTAIDHLRRHDPRRVSIDDDAIDQDVVLPAARGASPEEAVQRRDLREALDRALSRLRPAYRQAIILRHQEELAYDEIAAIMALPLGTVKTYLHRARQELARLMAAEGWTR